jgi:Helix-hairpin-helix domain
LAKALLAQFVRSSRQERLPLLERLRGESTPEALLMRVPGIGYITAERLHDELGITSLEELETGAARLLEKLGFKFERMVKLSEKRAEVSLFAADV